MGLLEVVLSAVVCAVVVLSAGRIATKAGYSAWWAIVPAAVAAVSFAIAAKVHHDARFGALSLHTLFHSARALVIADAAGAAVLVALLAVFAFSAWPALAAAAPTGAVRAPGQAVAHKSGKRSTTEAHRRGRASAAAGAASADVPARLRVRALPDVSGQPAGWFASGALGSGEQTYWDGNKWTARRCWRNEMWINQPVEPSLLAQPMQ